MKKQTAHKENFPFHSDWNAPEVQEKNISPLSGIFDIMLIFGVTLPSLETSRDQ